MFTESGKTRPTMSLKPSPRRPSSGAGLTAALALSSAALSSMIMAAGAAQAQLPQALVPPPPAATGSTPIQTCYEPRLHADVPNVTMAPFRAEGPYYAMLVGAAMFDTSGGPMVDSLARILDAAGQPIPGLFGAGCCVASAGGQAYWSGGAPIGLALTFGYLAGRTAAGS